MYGERKHTGTHSHDACKNFYKLVRELDKPTEKIHAKAINKQFTVKGTQLASEGLKGVPRRC